MPRIGRIVMPGYPHHIIQRGNRSQKVFFSDKDKFIYKKLLHEQIIKYDLKVWAYCLMDNHIHLIVVPGHKQSFKAISEADRRYTQMIHLREGWKGYLWQGRFSSFPMDEAYCYAAVRYVENNPVRAKIVKQAQDYHFSSSKYHVKGYPDKLLVRCYLQDEIKDWKEYLSETEGDFEKIRKHNKTGRPLGSEEFMCQIERRLGIVIRKQKPGPKPRI